MEEKTNIIPSVSEETENTPSHSSSEHRHSSHHSSGSHNSSGSSHHGSGHHHSSSSSSHHHHSSKHSSSHSHKKKKKKKPKEQTYAKRRTVFSFILFLTLSATAILGALKVSVFNQAQMSDIFTNSTYINALFNDVLEYSEDLCIKCNIPGDDIDTVITYKGINDIEDAYIRGNLDMDEMYSESTYLDLINDLNKELVAQIEKTVEENRLKVASDMETEGPKQLANEITTYLQSKVEFSHLDDIKSVVNISAPVLNIGIVLFAVLSVAFLLLTISFAEKKYRALRAVCYSVLGASALDILLVIFVGIVAIFKDLLLYPSYLCDSIMRYINFSVLTFLAEGLLLFLIGVMIGAFVWHIKRNKD